MIIFLITECFLFVFFYMFLFLIIKIEIVTVVIVLSIILFVLSCDEKLFLKEMYYMLLLSWNKICWNETLPQTILKILCSVINICNSVISILRIGTNHKTKIRVTTQIQSSHISNRLTLSGDFDILKSIPQFVSFQ